MENKVSLMHNSFVSLQETPNSTNLVDAKNKFLNAYAAWQKCSPLNFGPAVDEALQTINVFPTDTAKIRSNIANGGYNLNAASNIDAFGFPALDYLLFHKAENDILADLSNADYVNTWLPFLIL